MTAAHDLALSRGFLRTEDVDLIETAVKRLCQHRKAPLWVVNLGAGSGTTSLAVLCSVPEEIGVFIDCFDTSRENLYWCELAIVNIGRSNDHYSHNIDSVAAAEKFHDGDLDLLLIDTSHEYAHTVAEIAAWRPKLQSNGLVWLHDYVGDYPGVTRAVDEAIAAGILEPIEVRGLGWLGRYAR